MKNVFLFAIVALAATLFSANAIAGSASGMEVQLVVNDPVMIFSGALDQPIELGETATFSVVLLPGYTAPATYQWRKDGNNVVEDARISVDAITGVLTITNTILSDAGSYDCIVNNIVGIPQTSDAGILSFVDELSVVITSNPAPDQGIVSLNSGATVAFTSTVNGNQGAVTYQWQKNGVDIAGAENNSLTLNNVQPQHAGLYTLIVNDDNDSADSNGITLAVNVGVTITQQPRSQSVVTGQTATFTVSINTDATAPVSYQWSNSAGIMLGETGATLTISNCQQTDAGSYTVAITNPVGTVTSDAAVLNVTGSLQVTTTTQPAYVDENGVMTVRINPEDGVVPNAMLYINTVTGGTPPYKDPVVTKDGDPATNGTLTTAGSVFTYTVMNADNTDEGLYGFSISDSN